MKYAILAKLGGELISADEADYDDYKGFLRCPNCQEPIFLRKSHFRNEKEIKSSFVHYKAIPEVSVCELRVDRYTNHDVQNAYAKARGQRLEKLKISLWKYLKRNLVINLKVYPQFARDVKQIKFLTEVVDYGMDILSTNIEFIVDNTLPRVEVLLINKDSRIAIIPEMQSFVDAFIKQNKGSWKLHCKIAREALDLFLGSQYMKEIRYRLLCCLCHPKCLESATSELLDLDTETPEWREKFASYLTLQVTFVFLTVDWINIFDK